MIEQMIPIVFGVTFTLVIVPNSPESNLSIKVSNSTVILVETHSSSRGNINLKPVVSIIPILGHGKIFGKLVEHSNTFEYLRQIKESGVPGQGREMKDLEKKVITMKASSDILAIDKVRK